jgi:NAD(P)-dependent dehydrogenase (short-subunit alcohol dehydrogenase family)
LPNKAQTLSSPGEGAESVRLVEKAGGNGLFVRTDVAIEKEVEAMVARTVEYFGRLDFAFNNAGFGGRDGFREGNCKHE